MFTNTMRFIRMNAINHIQKSCLIEYHNRLSVLFLSFTSSLDLSVLARFFCELIDASFLADGASEHESLFDLLHLTFCLKINESLVSIVLYPLG